MVYRTGCNDSTCTMGCTELVISSNQCFQVDPSDMRPNNLGGITTYGSLWQCSSLSPPVKHTGSLKTHYTSGCQVPYAKVLYEPDKCLPTSNGGSALSICNGNSGQKYYQNYTSPGCTGPFNSINIQTTGTCTNTTSHSLDICGVALPPLRIGSTGNLTANLYHNNTCSQNSQIGNILYPSDTCYATSNSQGMTVYNQIFCNSTIIISRTNCFDPNCRFGCSEYSYTYPTTNCDQSIPSDIKIGNSGGLNQYSGNYQCIPSLSLTTPVNSSRVTSFHSSCSSKVAEIQYFPNICIPTPNGGSVSSICDGNLKSFFNYSSPDCTGPSNVITIQTGLNSCSNQTSQSLDICGSFSLPLIKGSTGNVTAKLYSNNSCSTNSQSGIILQFSDTCFPTPHPSGGIHFQQYFCNSTIIIYRSGCTDNQCQRGCTDIIYNPILCTEGPPHHMIFGGNTPKTQWISQFQCQSNLPPVIGYGSQLTTYFPDCNGQKIFIRNYLPDTCIPNSFGGSGKSSCNPFTFHKTFQNYSSPDCTGPYNTITISNSNSTCLNNTKFTLDICGSHLPPLQIGSTGNITSILYHNSTCSLNSNIGNLLYYSDKCVSSPNPSVGLFYQFYCNSSIIIKRMNCADPNCRIGCTEVIVNPNQCDLTSPSDFKPYNGGFSQYTSGYQCQAYLPPIQDTGVRLTKYYPSCSDQILSTIQYHPNICIPFGSGSIKSICNSFTNIHSYLNYTGTNCTGTFNNVNIQSGLGVCSNITFNILDICGTKLPPLRIGSTGNFTAKLFFNQSCSINSQV